MLSALGRHSLEAAPLIYVVVVVYAEYDSKTEVKRWDWLLLLAFNKRDGHHTKERGKNSSLRKP